MNFDKGVFF